MSKRRIDVLPHKHTVKKLLWGLAFLLAIVWIANHPYEARHALNQVAHALTVLCGGDR